MPAEAYIALVVLGIAGVLLLIATRTTTKRRTMKKSYKKFKTKQDSEKRERVKPVITKVDNLYEDSGGSRSRTTASVQTRIVGVGALSEAAKRVDEER